MDSRSVPIGKIDPDLPAKVIHQKIRDEYLWDSTVTVVLIGTETWKRKHVDWEIGASIRKTDHNPRSGLLGIFLPTHPDCGKDEYNPYTIPPRLYKNVECKFAELYDWSERPSTVQSWIHEAFERRNGINPNNRYPSFEKNRSGVEWQ
uniref:MTH538 TIR-like domain (DUF1863) n=1 Tax=Candidatus Kentrum sp. LPFa TaxID=2126335 RepID=A0A450WUM6_9GAMM|nr:MAG: MTH538 TIR-like domain (DUF1863) [Candidatus Kentron sp. LPFa]